MVKDLDSLSEKGLYRVHIVVLSARRPKVTRVTSPKQYKLDFNRLVLKIFAATRVKIDRRRKLIVYQEWAKVADCDLK